MSNETPDIDRISAEPSDAEVEAAVRAIAPLLYRGASWDDMSTFGQRTVTECTRAALLAAREVARHE